MSENEPAPPSAAAPDVESATAVGAQLAAARIARNLAVADVARQLKLSPWQIEALEAGNYERLPGAVFVRGFIRNYARFVELDPVPLLAAVEPRLPRRERPSPELPPSADIPFRTGREIPWSRYGIVVLALLAPLIIFELFFHDETPTLEKSSSAQPLVVPPSPMVGIAPTTSATVAAPAVNSDEKTDDSVDNEDAPAAELPVVHVAAVGGQHHLIFQFNQESWTEVRDGHGQRIFSQLNAAGTQQTVSGTPPLRLVVGNASGVRLQVNDKPFDMTPYTAIDVARFALE